MARRKLLMLSGVMVLCRLQVERINYHGPRLFTAIGAGVGSDHYRPKCAGNH